MESKDNSVFNDIFNSIRNEIANTGFITQKILGKMSAKYEPDTVYSVVTGAFDLSPFTQKLVEKTINQIEIRNLAEELPQDFRSLVFLNQLFGNELVNETLDAKRKLVSYIPVVKSIQQEKNILRKYGGGVVPIGALSPTGKGRLR